MSDRIVVLMSTYNGEKYIRGQLDSILNQTIANDIDIMVRDDGSNDETCNILDEYQRKYENIKYISGENIGYNQSFFELIKLSGNYKYYAFSDQDDIWFRDKLEIGYLELEKKDNSLPQLYGSCSLLVDEQGNEIGVTQQQYKKIMIQNTFFQNIIPGHTQIFNQKLKTLLCTQLCSKNIYVYDSWVTICASCFGEITFNNTYFTRYLQHSNNAYGYGNGLISWMKIRLHRLNNGETKAYRRQCILFYNTFEGVLNEKNKAFLEFAIKKKNFFQRVRFVIKYKPYRQKTYETLLLYCLILTNKY